MADDASSQQTAVVGLRRTPLYDLIQSQGARMTPFSGWEMPVQFSGITQEHQAVRQRAGLFDISHMGKFLLRGPGLIAQLQRVLPSDLSRLQAGQAQYSVLLTDQGGIIDDLIFYDQGVASNGDQLGVMIVNAATRTKDWDWLNQHLASSGVMLEDVSEDRVLLALQGPEAIAQLQPWVEADLSQIPNFGHLEAIVLGQRAFLARTGYTGEDGFEVMVSPEVGRSLWEKLMAAGVTPCGLGARDTLRLEAAMGLYGADMDETTTPLEASLGWVVHWDQKSDFIGRSALTAQKQAGISRKLVGLKMQCRNIARHGYLVLDGDQRVGSVTSGTLSPTLGYPIALAYVPIHLAKLGTDVAVEIRGQSYPAQVVKKPFYQRDR